jgi:hypothetical protein
MRAARINACSTFKSANNNEETFSFDMNARNTRLSDHDLPSALDGYAKVVDFRCFPATGFDKWASRRCQSRTISERFGSWKKALSIRTRKWARLDGKNIREALQANLRDAPQGL